MEYYNKNITIYDKFSKYGLQKDLLKYNFNDFNICLEHYLNNGFREGRNIYRQPLFNIKKTILFAFHELSFNGATKVGLDIASSLQNDYNIIIISQKGGDLIKNYTFENQVIIINNRKCEYNLMKYIDRKELAEKIIQEINPDMVYITSSVIHYFYHACCELNVKTIYHIHEGYQGYERQLNGYQIPIDNFHEYFHHYDTSNILYYSPSPLTTEIMTNKIIIDNEKIKEFQLINFTTIDYILSNSLECIQRQNLESILNNKQKNIGMIGLSSFRKGFDIFYNLSQIYPNYNFIWIGFVNNNDSGITQEKINNKPNNLFLINQTYNPYIYLKHLDYFLCTSREDLGPLVIIEALYLNIPTIYLKKCISLDYQYNKIGAYSINREYNLNSFKVIIDNLHLFDNNTNKELLLSYYSFQKNIEIIKNDIQCVLNTKINQTKTEVNMKELYKNINNILINHHKPPSYNEIIFKNKFNFIYDYFLNNSNEKIQIN